ncbi:MAG: alpha/beta hydrolase family protein [Rhodothalassiaceae bacterium]
MPKAPILLVHAADDHRVPVEHADAMADTLDDLGKPYEYVRIDWGGGHSLTSGEARLEMMQALEAFLLRHLDPGPVAQIEVRTQGGQ